MTGVQTCALPISTLSSFPVTIGGATEVPVVLTNTSGEVGDTTAVLGKLDKVEIGNESGRNPIT